MDQINQPQPAVGGWLLLLCVLLVVWGPIEFGLIAANALAALAIRGAALGVMLIVRAAVTALGIAAGLALMGRRGSAVAMTRASLVASAVMNVIVYVTPYWPSNRVPGDEIYYVAATVLYCGLWLAYLARSERVRRTVG